MRIGLKMEKNTLRNKLFWLRVSVVLSAAWIGIALIFSVLCDLKWWRYDNLADGSWLCLGGIFAIMAICNSIPWLYESLEHNKPL